jgi:hypothetical protein
MYVVTSAKQESVRKRRLPGNRTGFSVSRAAAKHERPDLLCDAEY